MGDETSTHNGEQQKGTSFSECVVFFLRVMFEMIYIKVNLNGTQTTKN